LACLTVNVVYLLFMGHEKIKILIEENAFGPKKVEIFRAHLFQWPE
jgi:hypothetical protein